MANNSTSGNHLQGLSNSGHYDILVVGAGPAGSRAAAAAAREGIATLLIDSKPRIGEQPHCGEFVPLRLFLEHGLDKSCVVQRVHSMETRVSESSSPEVQNSQHSILTGESENAETALKTSDIALHKSEVVETGSPGFVIDRVRFDRDLARYAAQLGATVLCSTRLIGFDNGAWMLRRGDEVMTLSPQFVIAADGGLSTVAKCLGLAHPEVLTGVQVEAPLAGPLEKTYVFLDRALFGGYGWLFPKGSVANVGIGVAPRIGLRPRRALEQLLACLVQEGMLKTGALARSGGVIPVSGLRASLLIRNVIFCGDAAGLTHPITGAGIPQAVFSGDLAGRAAAEAVKMRGLRSLVDYESEIRGRYQGVLKHALAKRHEMMQQWNNGDFNAICHRSWIAFKGYRKRSRNE